ncbi:MAG TPA: IS110 family transposase [Anaerolineae bacterium]|nr:IS110 family transposase [Anaerolineae bacterium]
MSRSQSPDPFAQGEIRSTEGLPVVNPHAAGADIGAESIYVCIPGPGQTQIVRSFGTYTADLHAIADWLVENGIQTIAMESTGIYWIPLFEVLEGGGIHCCLISGNMARRLPARHKTDVLDCQWIQTLHSLGLLTESFRPDADLIALRSLLRHRAQLIEHRSPHVLHMQKALIHMNIRLDQAVSDVTGQTGLAIIRAIVAGERDPHKLAALRNPRCKKTEDEIAQALTGTWREEHLFVLKQSLEFYDFYTRQIEACDLEIERTYSAIRPDWPDPAPDDREPLPPNKRGSHSKNLPKETPIRVRQHLRRLTGVDITAVDGLSLDLAQKIVSEIGTDMSQFPTVKHFTSWLRLCPNNQVTGGKTIRSSTGKSHNRARQAFLQAAASVACSDCAFGAFYRRLKARVGPAQAQVATAHKIARVVYHMLKFKVEYLPTSAQEYEQQFREREIRHLQRKAARLGFTLSPQPASGAVS